MSWLSYVPQHVADDLIQNPTESPIGREQRLTAVTLFADISGFTALSELLGKQGKIGTERLTQILNSYFEPMIDLIHQYGGIIGKFGGDAITVMFPFKPETQQITVQRSLTCTLALQAEIQNRSTITVDGESITIAMKVGLGIGQVYCTTVGDSESRLEFIIAGSAIDQCSDAEHHAERGEIWAHQRLVNLAAGVTEGKTGDTFREIIDLNPRAEAVPPDDQRSLSEVERATQTRFKRYLHPVIVTRLEESHEEFIDEHRRVTVLFVRFEELDYEGDAEVGIKLQDYFMQVVAIVNRFDGYLNKIDMGDKGSKYIIVFGAPVTHENDQERALRCALTIRQIDTVPVRIGVNTGSAYCGRVGSERRQEYTVMGDTVNIAARLMQFAQPNQIIVSKNVYSPVAMLFNWQPYEPISVKGKSEPIAIRGLESSRAISTQHLLEPAYNLPMVRRDEELAQIGILFDSVFQGQGQIIGLMGDAGMGKSRLTADAIAIIQARGADVYAGACLSYSTSLDYTVWRDIWLDFFGINTEQPDDAKIHQLETALHAANPAFVQRMPLLSPVLNLPIPENDITQSLEPGVRIELLHSLLLDCLRTRNEPIVLLLDDCHWIDAASRELLRFVGRSIASLPVLILLLYRPPADDREQDLIEPHPHFTQITLSAFPPEASLQLIDLKLAQQFGDDHTVPERFLQRITTRAEGNPFYIEELINYMHDQNIDLHDTEALLNLELPTSLENLILSRIDTLSEHDKTLLKVASVVGRLFRATWVYGSYPEVGPPENVVQQLNKLHDLELTLLDKPEPELEYLFKHVLTQEVTYGTIAFSTRAVLHERVATFIESQYPTSRDTFVDVLAYHFGQSDNTDKQREYFQMGADIARQSYSNQAAVYYYRRLLPLLPEDEQGEVLLNLGRVLQLTGEWADAEAAFRHVLSATNGSQNLRASARTALGDLLSSTESFTEAIDLLEQALVEFGQLGDRAGIERALKHLSFIAIQQSQYVAALDYARRQQALARELGNPIGISDAAQNIGLVHLYTGELDEAMTHFEAASDAAQSANYKQGYIYSLSNIAGVHFGQGAFADGILRLNAALDAAVEIGYSRVIGQMIGNMSSIYMTYGIYGQAVLCCETALRLSLELGDEPGILFALYSLSNVLVQQGQYANALRVTQATIPRARAREMPYILCGSLYDAASAHRSLGNPVEALPLAVESRDVATQIEAGDVVIEAAILTARLSVETGQTSIAEGLSTLRALVDQGLDETEQAAVLYTIWQLDPTDQTSRQTAAERYRELYATSPDAMFRQRYADLTGESLPLPPELSGVPAVVLNSHIPWDELIERLNTWDHH